MEVESASQLRHFSDRVIHLVAASVPSGSAWIGNDDRFLRARAKNTAQVSFNVSGCQERSEV